MSDYRKDAPCRIAVPSDNPARKTVVVLGCARGGTSMLAGTLRALRVPMGRRITGPNHEDADFMTADPAALRRAIGDRDATYDIWGWKYPNAIEYIDRIEGDLRNPHFIVLFRNTLAVATRFARYRDIPLGKALVEVEARYRRIVNFCARCTHPLMLVSYEWAVEDKSALIDGLIEFLGLERDERAVQAALAFIDTGRGYTPITEDKFSVTPVSPEPGVAGPGRSLDLTWHDADGAPAAGAAAEGATQLWLSPADGGLMPQDLLLELSLDGAGALGRCVLYLDRAGDDGSLGAAFAPRPGRNRLRVRSDRAGQRLRLEAAGNTPGASTRISLHPILHSVSRELGGDINLRVAGSAPGADFRVPGAAAGAASGLSAARLLDSDREPVMRLSPAEHFDIRATVRVRDADVGREGFIYAVARVDDACYYRTPEGAWAAWDGEAATLAPMTGPAPLREQEALVLAEGHTGMPGRYAVSVAYECLAGAEAQVRAFSEPLVFDVNG